MLISQISKVGLTKSVVILALLLTSLVGAAQLQTAVQVVNQTNTKAKEAQTQVDRLNDQTDELVVQYRTVLSEIDSLTIYNQQLEAVVNDQGLTIQSMSDQMTELESTNREIVPLVMKMVKMLGRMIEADLPFEINKRTQSVVQLENLLTDSNVTTSEIYRKVTEAYQIELDYGRQVSTYQGDLDNGLKVNFLQIGRTALLYQTLDEKQSGWYNPKSGAFEELADRFNSSIKEGIRIAAKQAAPDLIGLPILHLVSGE